MKIRNGFVSNSSSSSFVVLKKSLTTKQTEMILNIEETIEKLIKIDEKNNDIDNLKDKFSYFNTDPWRVVEYDDYIFGETSMDNFSMYDFFDYINVKKEFVKWGDGYNDEPYPEQLAFIKRNQRKEKLDIINNYDFLELKDTFSNLTNEQRLEIMNDYCKYCGSNATYCCECGITAHKIN